MKCCLCNTSIRICREAPQGLPPMCCRYVHFSLLCGNQGVFHASVLSVLVENEPGVLSRVAGLFSGRGFNIESLNVAPTLDPSVSHMTIATHGDAQIVEQIIKQLRKLVSVIKVVEFADTAVVEREMVVFRVNAEESKRSEIRASWIFSAAKSLM